MKVATILAVTLSGVAFAAPEIYATDKGEPFKDLTIQYSHDLPVAEAAASIERRAASRPVKDNRNLHYNANNKLPIAMAVPERRATTAERREAAKPVKDNRNLHYNANSRMPIAMASPERRDAPVEPRKTAKPVKDNRKLHYNVNNKMPIAETD